LQDVFEELSLQYCITVLHLVQEDVNELKKVPVKKTTHWVWLLGSTIKPEAQEVQIMPVATENEQERQFTSEHVGEQILPLGVRE